MNFGDKLQKIRKENNITQEGLADKLNVSRQAVSKWESGTAYPDTEKLIQISKIFNVSLDELVNDNVDMDKNKNNINKKISFMEIFNQVLEFISKSINMFWSMKFTEKIKCLFEIVVLVLIMVLIAFLSISIMSNILRRILIFLPSEWIWNICNLFETILFLVWIVLGAIIVIRIFKSRYLDYYVIVTDESVTEKTIEEPIKELKEKREYKVVIRDPKDSSLNIFRKIGKIFTFFTKTLCFLVTIPIVLLFIFCMLVLVFSLFYLFDGLFFNGITITILGVLLFIYLMIEFMYNILFNRTHAVNRMFVVFIGSISIIGVGLGLSFAAISNFTFDENVVNETNTHTIEMSDDLILYEMIYDTDRNVIIDNSLDDIKIEVTSYGNYEAYIYSYNEVNYLDETYKIVEVGTSYDEIEAYKDIISNLKEEKIVNYNRVFETKIYVSQENFIKLKENINRYTRSVWYE